MTRKDTMLSFTMRVESAMEHLTGRFAHHPGHHGRLSQNRHDHLCLGRPLHLACLDYLLEGRKTVFPHVLGLWDGRVEESLHGCGHDHDRDRDHVRMEFQTFSE
jgi:hypothetical protein